MTNKKEMDRMKREGRRHRDANNFLKSREKIEKNSRRHFKNYRASKAHQENQSSPTQK